MWRRGWSVSGTRAGDPALRRLILLIALVGAGWATVQFVSALDVESNSGYMYVTTALLAVGLYGATSTIELSLLRSDLKTILVVVTVGVLAKAALVGLVLTWAFGDPVFFVLAVAVAQIDPLSVAVLLRDSRMSARARTVLVAWSSFDDPVTVVVTLVLMGAFGRSLTKDHADASPFAGLDGFADLAVNVGLSLVAAVGALAAWWGVRRWWRARQGKLATRPRCR